MDSFLRRCMSLNPQAMQTTGSGSDDVGVFTFNGVYSATTKQINMTKKYQLGTGDPTGNQGHEVQMQLT